MNELYTTLVIAFVCAGVGFAGYVIGVVSEAAELDISNVGSEERTSPPIRARSSASAIPSSPRPA